MFYHGITSLLWLTTAQYKKSVSYVVWSDSDLFVFHILS